MKLKYLLFYFLILTIIAQGSPDNIEISKIRSEFYKSIESEEVLLELIDYIHTKFSNDFNKYPANILAYYGALEAVKAKYTFNPYSKLKHVKIGLKKLDLAVKKQGSSLEIRFLRFSVLDKLPSILGMSGNCQVDLDNIVKLLLLKNYSEIPYSIQKGIIEYILKTGRLSSEQERNIRSIYK